MITIDRSSVRDLRAILYRLKREYEANGSEEGFYANRNRIRQAHRQGELLVLRENGRCAGFHFKSSDGFGIVEIHPAHRGKGYGSVLATLWLRRAAENDEVYLAVECATAEAEQFWPAMGFTLTHVNRQPYAYRLLPKRYTLDPDGESVNVEIAFYATCSDEEAMCTHQPKAVRSGDKIQLDQRVICLPLSDDDSVTVSVTVDGKVVYRDSARASEAKALGIAQYWKNFYTAFYCDCLTTTASQQIRQQRNAINT